MGCVGSKESKGILTQQKEVIIHNNRDNRDNNNKINNATTHHNNSRICLKSEESSQYSSSALPANGSFANSQPTPSRHSPPVSRVTSSYNTQLDGLGSIGEVWEDQGRWEEFKLYLANLCEGEDSEGVPIMLDRYAKFLELFALLDRAERLGQDTEDRRKILDYVVHHEEDFFGRERCLKCIDGGMRREVLKRIREVDEGVLEPTTRVLAPIYSRVVDRLSELLGNYQNSLIEKINMAEQ